MKKTVRDIKKELEGKYAACEVYEYCNENYQRMHGDFLNYIDEEDTDDRKLFDDFSYELMDEEEYDNTIMANCCDSGDFEYCYGDKDAKVLIIIVSKYNDDDDDEEIMNEDRVKRLEKAIDLILNAANIIDEIREEVKIEYNYLPRNLKQGVEGIIIKDYMNTMNDIIHDLVGSKDCIVDIIN